MKKIICFHIKNNENISNKIGLIFGLVTSWIEIVNT